jgi:hypothetical protein
VSAPDDFVLVVLVDEDGEAFVPLAEAMGARFGVGVPADVWQDYQAARAAHEAAYEAMRAAWDGAVRRREMRRLGQDPHD